MLTAVAAVVVLGVALAVLVDVLGLVPLAVSAPLGGGAFVAVVLGAVVSPLAGAPGVLLVVLGARQAWRWSRQGAPVPACAPVDAGAPVPDPGAPVAELDGPSGARERRLRAVEALAAAGATEGEREAAAAALRRMGASS